jgi:hypothetical protein
MKLILMRVTRRRKLIKRTTTTKRKLRNLGNEQRRLLLHQGNDELQAPKQTAPQKVKDENPRHQHVQVSLVKSWRKNVLCSVVHLQTCLTADALLDEKVALDPTVLEWIERYEEDETAAMTEMVNFILRVCIHCILTNSSVADAPLKSIPKTWTMKIPSLKPSPKSKNSTNKYTIPLTLLITDKSP